MLITNTVRLSRLFTWGIVVRILLVVMGVLLGSLSSGLHAEVYKWIDADGKPHYSDQAPEKRPAERLQLHANSYTPQRVAVNSRVTMYSTSWCGYCKKARLYFRANRIAFTELDIEKNHQAKRQYDRLGGRGVPLILVGERRMSGFSIAGFNKIYRR